MLAPRNVGFQARRSSPAYRSLTASFIGFFSTAIIIAGFILAALFAVDLMVHN
jgi:hypothetical protein